MEIYLDNAASAKPLESALTFFANAARKYYANQEAIGGEGKAALKAVQQAGETVSAALAPGFHALFLNTATEAIETAVLAHFTMHPGTAAVTTKADHPALLKALERHAGKIFYVPLTSSGKTDPVKFAEIMQDPSITFCGLHHVNAETGTVQDAAAIRIMLGNRTFLLDTTQSACKLALPYASSDFMTISGAKIGAPCGGALLYRPSPALDRTLTSLRGRDHAYGRCVPAAALTIAYVVNELIPTLQERYDSAVQWKNTVLEELSGVDFRITAEDSSPYILHLLFPEKQGAVLVRLLGTMGVSVSAGSACLSETPEPSAVLLAMGIPRKTAFSSMRISLDITERPDPKLFANLLKSALKNY